MESKSETQQTRARADLKVLCVMFLFWGALFILVDPPRQEMPTPKVHNYYFNPFCFAFLVSAALWRRWATGRYLALAFTWLWLFAAVSVFLQIFPVPLMVVNGPRILPGTSETALRILVIPFFLAQLWQLHTLRRPAVVELFSSKRRAAQPLPPSALP